MKKKLAIKGHPTRGKEVIELLEMLGGKNAEGFIGTDLDELYTIEGNYIIQAYDWNNCACFTLEEFLEKYPYKVGDKVIVNNCSYLQLIIGMKWEGTIKYLVSDDSNIMWWFTAEELKDFNTIKGIESTGFMQLGKTCAVCFNKENYESEVELQLGDYEIEIRDGKTYAVLKKSKYPTTYAESCDVLKIPNDERYIDIDIPLNYNKLLSTLTELIICRDAYWKIAGEQMGLGKPWDSTYGCGEWGYWIGYSINENRIYCQDSRLLLNCLLVFPSKEMRDAFYENFKDLIEECKELL